MSDHPLEVAVRALDRDVLADKSGIVAGGCHAVAGAEGLAAAGEILPGGGVEVAKAVGAVLAGHAAEHDVGVLQAGVGEPEVVEAVVEAKAGETRIPRRCDARTTARCRGARRETQAHQMGLA
ncbi:hypothetical protein GCM10007890_19080 [Methylobacterium tardum]|uniref:Uncharacterized protein n=1 Tax=Methylobacterium tardum TaxID=374432 RepID=A0AA37WQ84_9HYPH|nr:hypothetical protein GCM10007890_19080 [Methylobacterium tardum]